MAITQETIVLNGFGLEEKRRTVNGNTKSRYAVQIQAEPIVHVFDAKALGKGPAEAIAEAIRTGIHNIVQEASASTRERRRAAAKGIANGAAQDIARYHGSSSSRMPPSTPGRFVRLFNDSGRFADSIQVGPTRDNSWIVNVAANRLDPTTFNGGIAALVPMYERLRSMVPALQGPEALARISTVKEAINGSIADLLVKAGAKRSDLMRKLRAGQWALVQQIARGVGL